MYRTGLRRGGGSRGMAPKCVCGWDIVPDPTGGGYSAAQSISLAGFRGCFATREGRGGKGKGGKGKGKQSKGDGSITSRFYNLTTGYNDLFVTQWSDDVLAGDRETPTVPSRPTGKRSRSAAEDHGPPGRRHGPCPLEGRRNSHVSRRPVLEIPAVD